MSRERRPLPPLRGASIAADCPFAPSERSSVYSRALHRACLVLGGVRELADHLQASESAVQAWLRGEEEPPLQAFLATVEILLLDVERLRKSS